MLFAFNNIKKEKRKKQTKQTIKIKGFHKTCLIAAGHPLPNCGRQGCLLRTLRNYNDDGKENVKNQKVNEQNNNSARASRLFVHFFAVPEQLRREMTKS